MIALLLLLFISTVPMIGFSQGTSVIVNPDGTHSVVHYHGNTSTQINSNGTHSIATATAIFHHGNGMSTKVDADGMHSTIFHHGNTMATQVNPDGIHSIIHHYGYTSIQDDPKGKATVLHPSPDSLARAPSLWKSLREIFRGRKTKESEQQNKHQRED